MRSKSRFPLAALGLAVLALSLAASASADVAVPIKSDGTDPTVFPNLTVSFGNVLWGVPTAHIFGLDPSFNPLPDADRFPNDFRGFVAEQQFLASPPEMKNGVGMVLPFGAFNNPTNQSQEILQVTFTVPLVDPLGNPLGGPGQRWFVLQFGPNAGNPGGGGGGGGGGGKTGTGGAHLRPPSGTPAYWAAFIRKQRAMPGETPDQFKARVKQLIKDRKKKSKASSIMKYMKAVDDSGVVDPHLNFVGELRNDGGVPSVDVELAFLVESPTFTRVARWIDNLSVALTNDASLVPLDADNQPPGEQLMDSTVIDFAAPVAEGEGTAISIGMGDEVADITSSTAAVFDSTVALGAMDVTFQVAGGFVLEGDGTTHFLDIGTTIADPEGALHRIPFDQPVEATAEDIAADLTFMVNNWPHDGEFKYHAVQLGDTVHIERTDGEPIPSAVLNRTLETELVQQIVRVSTACIGDVSGDGRVTSVDIRRVQEKLGTSDPHYDLDGNGLVDGADLKIVTESQSLCQGKTPLPTQPPSTPITAVRP